MSPSSKDTGSIDLPVRVQVVLTKPTKDEIHVPCHLSLIRNGDSLDKPKKEGKMIRPINCINKQIFMTPDDAIQHIRICSSSIIRLLKFYH